MLMTRNTLATIDAGEFDDGTWVHALLHRFADYYFDALEVYEQERTAAPAVWQRSHNATFNPETQVLQNLMLGVNAHINYDLVLTLVDMLEPEWASSSEDHRARRYDDHCHVNVIIGRTIDIVQDSVIERESPSMDIVDKLLGPIDEWVTSSLISHWRDEVWEKAVLILETADPGDRERLRQVIETETLERADAILFLDGPGAIKTLL